MRRGPLGGGRRGFAKPLLRPTPQTETTPPTRALGVSETEAPPSSPSPSRKPLLFPRESDSRRTRWAPPPSTSSSVHTQPSPVVVSTDKITPRRPPSPEEETYSDDFEDYEDDFEDEDKEENEKKEEETVPVTEKVKHDDSDLLDPAGQPVSLLDVVGKTNRLTSLQRREVAEELCWRAAKLKDSVTLEAVSYPTMFELHPLTPYECFVRKLGPVPVHHVSSQSNEDWPSVEVQTERCDVSQKSVQAHPLGDENEDPHKEGGGDLSRFLQRVVRVVGAMFREDDPGVELDFGPGHDRADLEAARITLHRPSVVDCLPLQWMSFCEDDATLLLVLYSSPNAFRSFLAVWDLHHQDAPKHILSLEGEALCCCFASGQPDVCVAGTAAGSVACWDLTEPASLHTRLSMKSGSIPCRIPTYQTDGITSVNHRAPIVSICPLPKPSSSSSSSSTRGPSVCTVDELGGLVVWMLVHIWRGGTGCGDASGEDTSTTTTGRWKITRSRFVDSFAVLALPFCATVTRGQVCQVDGSSEFLIGTAEGHLLRVSLAGTHPVPSAYEQSDSGISLPQTLGPAVCSMAVAPWNESIFLVGLDDGWINMYRVSKRSPIARFGVDSAITAVRWSPSRHGVFYVLYDESQLAVYDLLLESAAPVVRVKLPGSVVSLRVHRSGSDGKAVDLIALGRSDGSITVHVWRREADTAHTTTSTALLSELYPA